MLSTKLGDHDVEISRSASGGAAIKVAGTGFSASASRSQVRELKELLAAPAPARRETKYGLVTLTVSTSKDGSASVETRVWPMAPRVRHFPSPQLAELRTALDLEWSDV